MFLALHLAVGLLGKVALGEKLVHQLLDVALEPTTLENAESLDKFREDALVELTDLGVTELLELAEKPLDLSERVIHKPSLSITRNNEPADRICDLTPQVLEGLFLHLWCDGEEAVLLRDFRDHTSLLVYPTRGLGLTLTSNPIGFCELSALNPIIY